MRVKTVGPIGAKIMFVGEASGEHEDNCGRPFEGFAGKTLTGLMSQANINRNEVLITNVFKTRPPGNRVSWFFLDKECTMVKPEFRDDIEQLKQDIQFHKPNIVVALGNTALYALYGEKIISKFRGYILNSTLVPGQKLIATYHPQNINWEWKNHFPMILDLKKALRNSDTPDIPVDNRILKYDVSADEFINYCEKFVEDGCDISLDVETLQPGTHVTILGLAPSPDFAVSITLIDGRMPTLSYTKEKQVWNAVGQVTKNCPMIMQNGSYDAGVLLHNNGVYVRDLKFDTLIAAHICFPEMPRDLGFIASIVLDVPPWKHLANQNKAYYNAGDCAATFEIARRLEKQLKQTDQWEQFLFEMAEIEPALMMQIQGVKINKEVASELTAECDRITQDCDEKLQVITGRKINYNSPKQLQQLLYIDMGLPPQFKKRKSVNEPRKISADKKAIKRLKRDHKDNPMFDLLLNYKQYNKLRQFVSVETDENDYVYTSYNVTGKKFDADNGTDDDWRKSFGRWSSSQSVILPYGSGNLQNIPEVARKIYTAPEGYVFLSGDLVQAEAVVVAYYIGDNTLKKLFRDRLNEPDPEKKKKYDVHKYTGSIMFRKQQDDVSKEERRIGKTLRHASNYAAGPTVIADELGCSLLEAKKLLLIYYNSCPQLGLWHSRIQAELRQTRVLTNLYGRKHRFLDRWGDPLFRSAYSYKPQSSVGDHLNIGLTQFYNKYCHEVRMIFQLHDAFYLLVKEGTEEYWARKMYEECVRTIYINDEPMTIEMDFKVGPSWGESEDFPVWIEYEEDERKSRYVRV
jgi:uracil-DNA glycosylase family 4